MYSVRLAPQCHAFSSYLAHTPVTRVTCRLVFANYEDGTSRSTAFQTTLDGQPPDKDLHLKAPSKTVIVSIFGCKLKALINSKGSYPLADMETSDSPLDQVRNIFVR